MAGTARGGGGGAVGNQPGGSGTALSSGGFGGGGGGSDGAVGGDGGFGGGAGATGTTGSTPSGGGGGAGLGAAIFNNGGNVTIANCTFTANLALGGNGGTGAVAGAAGQGLGGAVFSRNGTLTILESTLSSNTAADGARDVYVLSDGAGNTATATLENCILGQHDNTGSDFVANTNAQGNMPNLTGSSHDLVRNNPASGGLPAAAVASSADPLLTALANNGGPTMTMALMTGSPAVHAGVALPSVPLDQRGLLRTAPADLGAFDLFAVDLTQSVITVSASSISYGATAIVTLQTKDSLGHNLTSGGLTVTFGLGTGTSGGSFSTVSDNHDGTYTATFLATTVGTPRTLTATISGSAVTSMAPTVTVTPLPLTITAVPNTKTYDGTTSAAAIPTVTGLVLGDIVIGLAESYATSSAGTGKTLFVSSFTLQTVNSGSNYQVMLVPNTASVILPLQLTITALSTSNQGNNMFAVNGSNTYATAKSYTVSEVIQYTTGSINPANPSSTAMVTSLGIMAQQPQVGGVSFWKGVNGQALINSFNGGALATMLSSWLATSFPNLYGANAGSHNLTGMTNAQVAVFDQQIFNARFSLDSEVLATALNVYATTLSLGGTAGQAAGFTVSANGLGAYAWNVGASGAAFGVMNNTTLNVYQLLLAANNAAVGGVLWNNQLDQRAQAPPRVHQPQRNGLRALIGAPAEGVRSCLAAVRRTASGCAPRGSLNRR